MSPRTATPAADPEIEYVAPGSPEEIEAEEQFERILSELRGAEDARVMLIRRHPVTNRLGTIATWAAVDFSIQRVMEEFGGGRYTAKLYKGATFRGSQSFEVDPDVKPVPKAAAVEVHDTRAAREGERSENGVMLSVLDRILERLEKLSEAPARAPGVDPVESSMQMVERVAKLLSAAHQVPAPAAAEALTVKDQLTMVKDLAELGRSLVGEGGGGSDQPEMLQYLHAAKEILSPVMEIVKDELAKRRGPRALAAPAPGASGAPPAEPQPQPTSTTDPTMEPWLQELARWMPAAVKEAEKNLSPESFASYMWDRLSSPTLASVIRFARQPDAVEQVARMVPALAPYQPWVQDWLTEIVALADEPEDEEEAPPVAGAESPPV